MVKINKQQRRLRFNKFNDSHPIKRNNEFEMKKNKKNERQKNKRIIKADKNRQIQNQPPNQQQKKLTQRKQSKGSNNKKKSQFSHLLGKSIFKVIPESHDGEKKDKFAALHDSEQNDPENQEQIEAKNSQQEELGGDEIEAEEEQKQFEEKQQNDDEQLDEQEVNEHQDEQQQNDQDQQQQKEELVKNQGQQQCNEMNDEQEDQNVDISIINLRIQETLQVLMNVSRLGEGKSRKYFVDKLSFYTHRYYGYNFELIEHFLNFLNPAEMIQFFEANETQRPVTIRTNTLKIRRKQLAQLLIQRGVNLDPLAQWSKVGIIIYDTKVSIGATPEYLAGYYMLQSASSFLPVMALDPKMNQKILDLAAAPGGKTTYIAQLMKNTGAIFANDLKKERLRALEFNLSRLGVSNTVITCRDGRKYHEIFPNTFDRVLLDAPCTGLGVISKDLSIKAKRVLLDVYKNSHVQKQLLLSAIDCTKVGGVIVYSTCSVSPLQNEQVINYALKKRYIKILDMDNIIEVGEPGLTKYVDKRYHMDLKKTKRIYPHVHNMDGFYYAKVVKIGNGKKEICKEEKEENR